MERKALCQCGQLQVTCTGEPKRVLMCHCELCQRRTGSAFNLAAWFPGQNVTVQGQTKTYQRIGERGFEITFHFCPDCGSSVCWDVKGTDSVVVAVGCFADPHFPAPSLSLYGCTRHDWVTQPAGIPSHIGSANSALE
ncbi:MAG: GFA family protein [Immundisolibacter sp.]|uniref:GFA family protein n=1 Tax=Immundisolibacter sp. TaxID=1934948 RepID=UPI003EE1DA26